MRKGPVVHETDDAGKNLCDGKARGHCVDGCAEWATGRACPGHPTVTCPDCLALLPSGHQ